MEKFPNVISGLKKIFKAQIFMLIGSVLFYASLVVMAVISLLAVSAANSGLAVSLFTEYVVPVIIFIVLMIAGLVVLVIGNINNIIGVKRAGKDEDGYNTAFWCILFSLVVTVVYAVLTMVLSSASVADEIASVISQVMSVLGIVFIIQSTQVVLVKKQNEEYALKGNNAVFFIILPYVISIVAKLVSVFATSSIVNLVVSIISLVCMVVGYILYLVFLKKSSKFLAAADAETEMAAE